MLRNLSINNTALCSQNICRLFFMNQHYSCCKWSAVVPVTTVRRYHQFWPASDVLVVFSLARDVKCYSTHFASKKTIPATISSIFSFIRSIVTKCCGSTQSFKAGPITHLPPQVCARQTCGTAPLVITATASVNGTVSWKSAIHSICG